MIRQKSVDEVTDELVDAYDEAISPKYVVRSKNNKLWLIFKSFAAGFVRIIDAVLALRNRFDPFQADEEDLESTARMMGVRRGGASASLILITATNTSDTLPVELAPGVYTYTSADGMVFAFQLIQPVEIVADGDWQVHAMSQQIGAHRVSAISSAQIVRQDSAVIDPLISWAIADNEDLLGHEEEDLVTLRKRMADYNLPSFANEELRDQIKLLPNIFDCEIVHNASASEATVYGVTLGAYQALLVISGAPTDAVAELCAKNGFYNTKQIESEDVLYFYHDTLAGGKLPVYWKPFEILDYDVDVTYLYDANVTDEAEVEAAITAELRHLKYANRRQGIITVADILDLLDGKLPSSARVIGATFTVDASEEVVVRANKIQIPRLSAITFTPEAENL